jgi:CDAN1-interacting nuclease 1
MVAHRRYVQAYEQLNTVADARRLAEDGVIGLSYDTLQCILAQKLLARSKSGMRQHRDAARQYVERFQAGETLIAIAESVGLAPTQLARLVLEDYLGARKGKEAGALLKDPRGIAEERLREQVAMAVEFDPYNGPYVDRVRACAPAPSRPGYPFTRDPSSRQSPLTLTLPHCPRAACSNHACTALAAQVKRCIGLEYEYVLEQKLAAHDIPFFNEGELRERGDAKTPDALLSVPLLVRGRIVMWIDSKATFGDPDSHVAYHANQYSGYLNRYGAGLVIYWFGFDDSIDIDPRLLILDTFPDADCELMACMPTRAAESADLRHHRSSDG